MVLKGKVIFVFTKRVAERPALKPTVPVPLENDPPPDAVIFCQL